MSHWSSQSTFYGPASAQSQEDRRGRHVENLRPLSKAAYFATEFQKAAITAIVRLLLSCRPAAVLGRIRAIIIGMSIKSVSRCGSWPHVLKECLKRIIPPFAHYDPSAAIARVALVMWVGATVTHIDPCDMFRRLCHAVCCAVATPAAFAFPAAKTSAIDSAFASASTAAEPLRRARTMYFTEDRPQPELLASKVYESRVAGDKIGVSHQRTSLTGLTVESPTGAHLSPGSFILLGSVLCV